MNKIYKYSLNTNIPRFNLELPAQAKILSFQVQNTIPTIWVLVDTENTYVTRSFEIYGIGHIINNTFENYIGTVQVGNYVWHLFEKNI